MGLDIKYRNLVEGDKVQEGDQWYNPDWYADGHIGDDKEGPWYSVRKGSDLIGDSYGRKWRPMRRLVDSPNI
ncbi:hypothetical protein GOV13_02345 [Candidatus Pacearchaeota archaeon]|nr:hypothetical protein [Candidatus Pacearchaeota archaeon]